VAPVLTGPFFMDLFEAVRRALQARGLRLYLTTVSSHDELVAALDELAGRRVRGAVVVPPAQDAALPATLARALPVVCLLGPLAPPAQYVAPDEERTGRDAAAYLHEQGHRRILHVTFDNENRGVTDRARGYEQAMDAAGLEPVTLRAPDAATLLQAVGTHRATALFCHNDWLALTTLRTLGQAGVRVPEDVSVLGVDNSPTFTSLAGGITTLQYPYESVAARTAQLLGDGEAQTPVAACTVVPGRTVQTRNQDASPHGSRGWNAG
jgi:DNA-binding LacI/PurR family transcriptional regulator